MAGTQATTLVFHLVRAGVRGPPAVGASIDEDDEPPELPAPGSDPPILPDDPQPPR